MHLRVWWIPIIVIVIFAGEGRTNVAHASEACPYEASELVSFTLTDPSGSLPPVKIAIPRAFNPRGGGTEVRVAAMNPAAAERLVSGTVTPTANGPVESGKGQKFFTLRYQISLFPKDQTALIAARHASSISDRPQRFTDVAVTGQYIEYREVESGQVTGRAFSDSGFEVYFSSTPELMKRAPGLTLERVVEFSSQLLSLSANCAIL